jgi:hypothetical protein
LFFSEIKEFSLPMIGGSRMHALLLATKLFIPSIEKTSFSSVPVG